MSWDQRIPLIAILRGIKPSEIHQHLPLLIEAGFDAIEIPLNSPNWQISIRDAVQQYSSKALIGAGTVLEVSQVDALAEMGCQLIVTPNINPEVIKRAVAYGMVVCPGFATATEAFTAIAAGATNLKLFPSHCFGPEYVRGLKAVLPKEIPVFAVGGITPENLHQYIDAGCIGAGLGGDLYRAGQTPEKTQQQAVAFIQAYRDTQK